MAVVECDDGLEEPQPQQEVCLVVGRPLQAGQPFEVGAVTLREPLLALVQTLLRVRQLRHVAEFQVAPCDVQVEET